LLHHIHHLIIRALAATACLIDMIYFGRIPIWQTDINSIHGLAWRQNSGKWRARRISRCGPVWGAPGAFAKSATSCSAAWSIWAEEPLALDPLCVPPGPPEIRKTPTEKPFGKLTWIPSTEESSAEADAVLVEVVASDRHCELFEYPVTPPVLILISVLHHWYLSRSKLRAIAESGTGN
jgi:hypothetical protein